MAFSPQANFSFKYLLSYSAEVAWTLFQTERFSENLAAPGIEPRTSGSIARNHDHYTPEAVLRFL
jgi:hypothetical protein